MTVELSFYTSNIASNVRINNFTGRKIRYIKTKHYINYIVYSNVITPSKGSKQYQDRKEFEVLKVNVEQKE